MEEGQTQNNSVNSQQKAQIAVLMVPFPTQGHLNQLLHLSHLLTTYNLPVHYAASATHNRQAKLRHHGWDSQILTQIHFHDLEIPPFNSPPPNPNQNPNQQTHYPAHRHPIYEASLHLRQPVYHLLQELATKFRRVVVIHDSLMSCVVQDVKSIPNSEAYTFVPISAFTMFFGIWNGIVSEKPFQLDSDVPTSKIPSSEGCLTPEVAEFLIYQRKFSDFQSGRLYNTCRVIEGKYVELLERVDSNMKHFAIGPFNPVETQQIRHGCLEWLDKQEKGCVIYVSFGSTTSMSDVQIRELAIGLERSGEKFIWVLRNADKCDVFAEGEAIRQPQLPEGYEERVRNRGLVIREWAPQLGILAHPSTGGFISHCGWNSCSESISMGVPIAAWPMHSDQPRNAVLVTEVLRTGILVRDWAHRSEVVTSKTIENAVRRLMESEDGAEIRRRASELGDAVRGSVAKGGVSRLEMEAFIAHITR